jgi:hypothetical protein
VKLDRRLPVLKVHRIDGRVVGAERRPTGHTDGPDVRAAVNVAVRAAGRVGHQRRGVGVVEIIGAALVAAVVFSLRCS